MARNPVADQTKMSTLLLGRLSRKTAAGLGRNVSGFLHRLPGRTDRLVIAPQELRTADATQAAEIYAGRFVFAGKIVACAGRSPFDAAPPSPEWEAALLGFSWLRHLRAADSAITRANARALISEWMARQSRLSAVARRPDVVARRIISFLSQAPFVLSDADGKFYRRYLRMLTNDVRLLRYAMIDVPDGLPRLQVMIALCYASLCMANQERAIRPLVRRLSDEITHQILPDGGHISRNPGALIDLLLDFLPLRQTFAARNIAPPPALMNAIDRMIPMLRFFRHGDGSFGLFNGMGATPSDLVATVLVYDDTHGAPLENAPYSGYQRMEAGNTMLLVDTGASPPIQVSNDAHAGCLSFEFSSGTSRIIVNSGMPSSSRDNWRHHARATAAHSTLTFNETSSCKFVEIGAMRRFLQGAPITHGPQEVSVERTQREDGTLLVASHDGYAEQFGVLHRRALLLSSDGGKLDGEDMLIAPGGGLARGMADDYELRFHLHPQVKVNRLHDAHGAMLILPNREAWTFDAYDDVIELEESAFLAGHDGPRRTTQIVIRARARQVSRIRWSLTRAKSSPAATIARRQADREPELPL
jgi:uncharacterized heparinase superfamily protein